MKEIDTLSTENTMSKDSIEVKINSVEHNSNSSLAVNDSSKILKKDTIIKTDTSVNKISDSVQVENIINVPTPKIPKKNIDISNYADSIPLKNSVIQDKSITFIPEYFQNIKIYSDIKIIDNTLNDSLVPSDSIEQSEQLNNKITSAKQIALLPDDYKSIYIKQYVKSISENNCLPIIEKKTINDVEKKDVNPISEIKGEEQNSEKEETNKIAISTKKEESFNDFSENYIYKINSITPLSVRESLRFNAKKSEDYTFYIQTVRQPKPQDVTQIESIVNSYPSWVLWYILAGLSVFIWLRIFFSKYLSSTIKAGFNSHIANKLFKENNQISVRSSLALNLLFFVNIGLFISQTLYKYKILDEQTFLSSTALVIGGMVMMIYIIKYIVLKLLGFIFKSQEIVSEYLSTVFLYNKILGVTLFPIVICMAYLKVPELPEQFTVYVGISTIAAFYVLRILRGVLISIRAKFSIFYLILYLCALEIGPLLLLYKFLKIATQFLN